MSILDKTTNLELTQYGGSPAKAQFYSNYNADMLKIDTGYQTLDESINGTNGLGDRVSALESSVSDIDNKADGAVSTANEAKETADGMSARVTVVEDDVSALKTWKNDTVDPTLTDYDNRLDAIELVIDTVSTANIDDLIARMDALEQKVDANTQAIDTLNSNLISAVDRIEDLESGLGTTNANLNALSSRVSILEDCCTSVRETLADHNTRINKNASDISALDARLTRDETNIAGNASDITILATQNNTQAEQIDDLYDKYNALDPTSPTNLYSRVSTLEEVVGDTPLQTTAQTVTGAINELYGTVTDVDADEVEYDNTNSQLVATDVQGAIDEVVGTIGTDEARIEALETTVGGAGSGLVKDVSDLGTSVGALETTVGDNNSGLVKDVADLGTTVGDSSAGLVKDVADLQTAVGDSSAGLVKDVGDLQTTIGDASAGLVKDVADVQSVIPSGATSSNKLATADDLLHVYSTTEKKVGKWIDNRDVYEITVTSTTPNNFTSGNYTFNLAITNFDYAILMSGATYRNPSAGTRCCCPIVESQNTSQLVNTWYEPTANKMHFIVNASNSYESCTIIVTMQYVKTV